jgi:histidinol-phosphatase (PHP family)
MTKIEPPQSGACRGLADYHVHTTISCDARVRAVEYVERVIPLGLQEIGFAEHADLDPRDPGYNFFSYEKYMREIALAREAADGRVIVRTALEVNYQRSRDEFIRQYLADRPVDYLIGSTHLINDAAGWCNVSEPESPIPYFAARDKKTVYAQYWAELRAATDSGLFDILGHLDLIKRFIEDAYGAFRPEEFEEEIRDILKLAVEKGVGLEINASGWRQPPQEQYPALGILRWYRELGGEILTLGSDVHWLPHTCFGLPEAAALAKSLDFRAVATFAQRRLRWLDLPR